MDAAAFQDTVRDHKDRLFGLAVRLTGDRAEAEDVVQESFIKLWQQEPKPPGTAVLPWLLTVTRNASLDRLRRRRLVTADQAVLEARPDGAAQPDRQLAGDEFGRRLNEAVNSLREPFRSLVILREIQGLEYQDIAQTLSLSLSQVKVYLHRARRQLRQELSDFANE